MIKNLIDKYNSLPSNADLCIDRHLNILMQFAIDSPHLQFDGDSLVFLNAEPPFHKIEIERIVGVEDLGMLLAIILPNAAITIHKTLGDISITLP